MPTKDLLPWPNGVAASALQSHGFVDTVAAVRPDADSLHTWRWWIGPVMVKWRIDYVYASENFQPIATQIIRSTGSDHDLVVSLLRWRSR